MRRGRTKERWTGAIRRLLDPPDELMLEAGAIGEVLVARIRLVVVSLIVLMPPIAWLSGARIEEVVTGGAMASVALVFAVVLLHKVRRDGAAVRWRFLSAAFDITSISLVLALFLVQGLPHVAINSRVVYELYLLSIAATALRGDRRVCLFAGGLALVQYGAIIAAAVSFGDLNDASWAPFLYGFHSWGDQMSRLILIAAMTLLALACVHQTRKLLQLSSQDRLTGIRNRAWLDSRLERELGEAALTRRSVALAMIDVDDFKEFNDRFGHLAGDAALRSIAERLAERIESPGVVARYGGEEFTVILPDVDPPDAGRRLDVLRATFESDRIDLPGNENPVASPTLSIGVAGWAAGDSAEALIDRADRALIRAKRAGRNRVVVADADAPAA
ncbi:GGDEF domain-containing protein [Halomonas denitrificans]|nr:GGDEF domain-containing protein [Halomonas denitrificans]